MYFESRSQAGYQLACSLLEKYRYENCVVVAVNEGGVLVGEQIAASLHCLLTVILSEEVEIPGESLVYGNVSQSGEFTINSGFSKGEVDGYEAEFHGYFEEKKRESFQKINRLVGENGTISLDMLRNRVVIVVSDGFDDPSMADTVMSFLKPIRIERLVVVSPVATIGAVDRLHVLADELKILDVKANYMGTNHYYDDNWIPDREEIVAKISQMILNWR